MSNSALVTYKRISPNKTINRNHVIDTITIHCMAGNLSVEACGDLFARVSKKASSNYGIGSDGRIALYVEEKDRSWCSSNALNDHRAVTIEVANDGGAPDWHVSDKAMTALIELAADICKRNQIKELKWKADKSLAGQVDKQNMTVHRWFAAKACPGDYLYEKHGYIAEQVNLRLNRGAAAEEHPDTEAAGTAAGPEEPKAFPYRVRVKRADLCIRKGAGVNGQKAGFTGKGVFTIVEEADGAVDEKGTIGRWGLLKSYQKDRSGWICLDCAEKRESFKFCVNSKTDIRYVNSCLRDGCRIFGLRPLPVLYRRFLRCQ